MGAVRGPIHCPVRRTMWHPTDTRLSRTVPCLKLQGHPPPCLFPDRCGGCGGRGRLIAQECPRCQGSGLVKPAGLETGPEVLGADGAPARRT